MLKNFNKTLIQENDSLLIAVSGGIDSMVMLHNIYKLSKERNIKISVAHFDHQKRSDSSQDALLVKNTCEELSIDFYVDKLNPEEIKDNFHDYSRTRRYDFFKNISTRINANKIVLAHNSNDVTETILMRLTRGSSFEGYRGILETTNYKGVTVIRPLLKVSRNEISQYQVENNILYNEDSSNSQDDYTRNRYRHNILPLLEQENPKYLEKFQQFSEYTTKAYQLINKLSLEYIQSNTSIKDDSYTFEIDSFSKLDEIIQIDVIKKIINLQTNNQVELTFQNIKDILKLTTNQKPHLEFELENHLFIHKSYHKVFISNCKSSIEDYEFKITEPTEIILPNGDLVAVTKNPNKYYGFMFKLCYNIQDFNLVLTVRNRRNGDKVKTKSGTKKIKDIFINKKLPLQRRNKLPVFLNEIGEIIWVPDTFKEKTKGNECIYLIYQEGHHA